MLGGQGHGLAGHGDMHPGQQLVDHLESRALTGLGAQFVDLGGHGVQGAPRRGEGLRRARGHDGQFALGRAHGAAADRGVEIKPAGGFQRRAQPPRDLRVHGGRRDEHRARRHGFGRAVRAEQHRFRLGGVDHHRDHHLSALRRQGRGPGRLAAVVAQALQGRGRDVAAGDREPRAQQRPGHAGTHGAQADHGHARLGGRHPGTILKTQKRHAL